MGGRDLCFLLALITAAVQPFLTSCNSSCDSYSKKLASKSDICGKFSCRNKCNRTLSELRRSGTQQMCYCDEKCVMFDDCCVDFTSVCVEVYEQGGRKYPQLYTECHSHITIINGAKSLPMLGTSTVSTEGTTLHTTSATTDLPSDDPSRTEVPDWAVELRIISNMKIDRALGLAFLPWFHVSTESRFSDMFSYTPVKFMKAELGTSTPFSQIEYLEESEFISIRSVKIPGVETEALKRECLGGYFGCPNCDIFLRPEEFCLGELNDDNSQSPPLETAEDNEIDIFDCTLYSFAPSSIDGSSRNTESVMEVTVIPDPVSARSIILSNDLPWAQVHCERIVTQDVCSIQRCSVGRLLSPNHGACFIPSRISVLVIKRIRMASQSSSQQYEESVDNIMISTPPNILNNLTTNNNETIQKDTQLEKVRAPLGLCMHLYRALSLHTQWIFRRVSLHRCRYYGFRFNSVSNLPGGTDLSENPELFNLEYNNTVSIFNSSKIEQFDNDAASNLHSGLDYYPDLSIAVNDDTIGIQQAWKLIHDNLDHLSGRDDILDLELCFEAKPELLCKTNTDLGLCEEGMSRCFSYKPPQTSAGADKTFSFFLHVFGLVCCLTTLHLSGSKSRDSLFSP